MDEKNVYVVVNDNTGLIRAICTNEDSAIVTALKDYVYNLDSRDKEHPDYMIEVIKEILNGNSVDGVVFIGEFPLNG